MSSIYFFIFANFLADGYPHPSAQKFPLRMLVLADSQIQSSPFACLLTVCRVFYLDETLLWAGYVASRRVQAATRRKMQNFYPKLLRAGIEAVPRKRIKCMSVVVQLCVCVHVHESNLHLSKDFFSRWTPSPLHREFTAYIYSRKSRYIGAYMCSA